MVRTIKSPTGSKLHCKGWVQEAAYRMIQNNLDPNVAEHPEDLVVYGGRGKAARDWPSFDRILKALTQLEEDETLLIQSGKPVGIVKTHKDAPRVLIANSNLVGKWANWEVFDELERKGLMMYGQMTAGSWIYIGTQGIVQGTYETFVEAGRRHFNGDLTGKCILTAGLGGMGGAQPLAGVFAGACVLAVDVDPTRIQRRLETKYVDEVAADLDDALKRIAKYRKEGTARSVALLGNMSTVIHQLIDRGFQPDILTDQTSGHDPLLGYIPEGYTLEGAAILREKNPTELVRMAKLSMAKHVDGMLKMQKKGQSLLTTETTFGRWPKKLVVNVLLISQVLCPNTFVRCFA